MNTKMPWNPVFSSSLFFKKNSCWMSPGDGLGLQAYISQRNSHGHADK